MLYMQIPENRPTRSDLESPTLPTMPPARQTFADIAIDTPRIREE
jgi:hypothetical protein